MYAGLRYVKRRDIDIVRWDHVITQVSNGLIYAHAFYLDNTAAQWDALILNDYEAVMPVTWNKKWGIKYMYTPAFIQRLGIYGNVSADIKKEFVKAITSLFSYVDINTDDHYSISSAALKEKVNYILPLDQSYLQIKNNYSRQCRDNIRKAVTRGCSFAENIPVKDTIALYRKVYGHYHRQLKEKDYVDLYTLALSASEKGQLISCGVKDAEGTLLSGALIFRCPKRLYYMVAAPDESGRKARAPYYLIDQLLQRYAGTSLVFDFEGSDIENVADFYQRFGAADETYFNFKFNGLPWPLTIFKR